MPSVTFHNSDVNTRVKNKRVLKEFIFHIFQEEKTQLDSLSVIFCSDEYLLALNKQFLDHDYYTDILTFDLSSGDSVSSEIYISIDRVKENSRLHHETFDQELNRIVFHGALHLCGYGDKTEEEKKTMTKKENEYLDQFSRFHVKL